MPFLILFFLVSLAEVYVFALVGSSIGAFKTLLLCILTALIGGFVVRLQGLETLMKAQNHMRQGQMPLEEIFSGFCIVVAGALLLTPGFVTDIIGFLLLFPPFRVFLKSVMAKHTHFSVKNTTKSGDSTIIEGDYERVDKNYEPLDHTHKDN